MTVFVNGVRVDSPPSWEDMKFPFFGRRLDRTSGHLDYDLTELGVKFDSTSRYNDNDIIGLIAQVSHQWKIGTNFRPHIHWIQNQNKVPNIIIKYRLYDNGHAVGSWQVVKWSSLAFTYVSGSILQIIKFPEIDMSSIEGVSSFLDIKIYRDSSDSAGLFGSSDSYSGDVLLKEFDIHYQVDGNGSDQEYVKSF